MKTARQRRVYRRLSRMMRWVWSRPEIIQLARDRRRLRIPGEIISMAVASRIEEWKEKHS